MPKLSLKGKLARVAAAAAILGLGATALLTQAPTSGADPKSATAFVGVGSDTIQDVANALSGFANNTNYAPLQSSTATGSQQILSFDALNPTTPSNVCITPKVSLPTMYRSNGSTEGRAALSRAIDGTGYGPTTSCGGTKDVSGMVDFARSSSGPASGDTATDLTYIPFARDGVSFAYVSKSGVTPVTDLTRAQLTAIYSAGAGGTTIGSTLVIPCGIQDGSGTYKFFLGAVNVTAAQESTATSTCNAYAGGLASGGGRVEENNATTLQTKLASAPANAQLIVGFSAGSFIAQSNNVAPNSIPTTGQPVNLGSVNGNAPFTGAVPTLTPNATFFNDAIFGRNLYFVFDTARVGASGNAALKSMFVGPTSAICSAPNTTTVNKFGFLSLASGCGSTSLTGALIAGIK